MAYFKSESIAAARSWMSTKKRERVMGIFFLFAVKSGIFSRDQAWIYALNMITIALVYDRQWDLPEKNDGICFFLNINLILTMTFRIYSVP